MRVLGGNLEVGNRNMDLNRDSGEDGRFLVGRGSVYGDGSAGSGVPA